MSQKTKSLKKTAKTPRTTTLVTKTLSEKKECNDTGVKRLQTGRTFGELTIVGFSHKNRYSFYHCKCSCGGNKVVAGKDLTYGHIKSCGCLQKRTVSELFRIPLEGKKFGRLKVVVVDCIKGKRIYWKCLCKCGKTASVRADHLREKKIRSCGCLDKDRNRKGVHNPHWRHDLSSSDREANGQRHLLPKARAWRKRVFTRDNYTCQISGKRGGVLCAHHLSAWNKSKSLRYVTANGITLSAKIHRLFHAVYGRGNNTKRQFLEFCRLYKRGKFKNLLTSD